MHCEHAKFFGMVLSVQYTSVPNKYGSFLPEQMLNVYVHNSEHSATFQSTPLKSHNKIEKTPRCH